MAKKQQPLTLHQLLGSLSFWGSATRAMLFGFLAFMTYLVALSETTSSLAADNQLMVFIYVLGCFLLLDVGYVMIARAYKLSGKLDLLVLVVAQTLLALLYIVPKLVVSSSTRVIVDPLTYVFFIPLVVLVLRLLVGLLFGKRA